MSELGALLDEIEAYLADKADTKDSSYGGARPNEEARLLIRVQEYRERQRMRREDPPSLR